MLLDSRVSDDIEEESQPRSNRPRWGNLVPGKPLSRRLDDDDESDLDIGGLHEKEIP